MREMQKDDRRNRRNAVFIDKVIIKLKRSTNRIGE